MLSTSHAMMLMNKKNPKVLLVVDNEPSITRLVRRICAHDFEIIYTACSSKRAKEYLRCAPVTHLVCDFDLNESKNGVALICKWRSEFPRLQRTVLFTGSDFTQFSIPNQIDAVLQKGEPICRLRAAIIGPNFNNPRYCPRHKEK